MIGNQAKVPDVMALQQKKKKEDGPKFKYEEDGPFELYDKSQLDPSRFVDSNPDNIIIIRANEEGEV